MDLPESFIGSITAYVLGDDNVGLTELSLMDLDKFVTWFTNYAKERWNMTISESKTIVTENRNKMTALSYSNKDGMPSKDDVKMLAQLCYPEHKFDEGLVAYRVIGHVYASCGCSRRFYDVCKLIHKQFASRAKKLDDLDEFELHKIVKSLPSLFTYQPDNFESLDLTRFPEFEELRDIVSKYHGELSINRKWNKAHFIGEPEYTNWTYITMSEYRRKHNIPRQTMPDLHMKDEV